MSDQSLEHWFCEECQESFISCCPLHGAPLFISDCAAVPGTANRAARTLPTGLLIHTQGDTPDVHCARQTSFPKGALFGPYEGELVNKDSTSGSNSWIIVDSETNSYQSIDGSDETKANWMRFVRASSEDSERNLTAFQHDRKIYFRATRRIEPGDKLCVWYSETYIRQIQGTLKASMLPILHSSLQNKPNATKPTSDESDGQPSAKRKKIDLIFKDVLEASLDTSSHSDCQSNQQLKSCENFNISNLKIEPVEEEIQAEPSTSFFCPNCVRLKRRILELEQEVKRLRGEDRPMAEEHDQQAPPHPEQGPIEDLQGPEPLTPSQPLEEEEQDMDSADETFSTDLLLSPDDKHISAVGGRRIRRFKQEWLKKFWFLRYSPTINEMWCHVCRQYTVQSSRTSAFILGHCSFCYYSKMWCHVCRQYTVQSSRTSAFILGSKQFKIHTIKLHSQSNLHKKCLQLYKLRMHPEKTEEMCKNMLLLFNAAYHVASEGRPYSDLRPLAELLKRCELKVVDQYMNEGDCQILVHHIARALREDLLEKMRLSPFLSVIMDAQNDDTFSDTVAVYVQFLTNEGAANTEFLSLQRLSMPSTDGYLQAIDRAFTGIGLRFQDLLVVGLGVDGSNMSAALRCGVCVSLQKTFPWLLSLPLIIHRPHLEVLDTISGKELPCLEDLENNLKQLLSFYRYSPRMMSELRCTAPTLSDEAEFLGDVRAVRWIIGEPNVLNALIKDYMEVLTHLKDISGQSQRADAAAIALSLLQFLTDYQSVKLIYFLLDVIAVFSRLAFAFQGEYLMIASQVESKIQEAVEEIGQLADSPGEYLQEFEENFRESFNGVALENLRVAEAKFQSIRDKICNRSQGILRQRLDVRSRGFAKACKVLDLAKWPPKREELQAFGEEEIQVLLDHVETFPSGAVEGDRASVLGEWRELKSDYCSANSFKDLSSHINRYRQRFPVLHSLSQVVRVLPSSSSRCDRGRSSLTKTCKNNHRSKLTPDLLNDTLTLAVNGPPIAGFDGKRALDSWFEEKSSGNSFSLSRISEQKNVLHSVDVNSEF